MTEPSPLQVALNSNAVGPEIGSADTPLATMSETAPAATIVAIKRLIRHLLSGCRRCLEYPMAGLVLQVEADEVTRLPATSPWEEAQLSKLSVLRPRAYLEPIVVGECRLARQHARRC